MRISFPLLAVAALMTMAACSDDADFGNDTLAKPQPLVFVATQDALTTPAETRAATNGTWDGNEEIAIKIGDEVKKYKIADTSGTLELDASTTPFYRTDKSDIEVKAWYPYSDTEPAAPTVSTDQSSNQESNNLMKATATAKYGESTTLAFSHQTARIRLHLYKEGTTDNLTGGTVKVKVTNAGSSALTEYTAHEDGEGYYSVLVAPGATISSGADFVSITDGNVGPYKATAPADVTFVAGKSYTYNFTNLNSNTYVTFSAESEQGFKMTLPTGTVTGLGTFEYSVGADDWTTITSGMDFVKFGGSKGDLKLRGISTVGTYKSVISFENNVPVAASGDIRTLVDYRKYKTVDTGSARFTNLFKNCKSLTSAPVLPATTLAEYCYSRMFEGCTSLTTAPTLPATALAEYCYDNMFTGCTSLTTAPTLPATKLANACYYGMFIGCTSLTTAPELPATTLAVSCYAGMFNGCKSLTSAPTLPATTLAVSCYAGMFDGCKSLTSAPALPATTLAAYCYNSMFSGCTSLTTAPALPVTRLAFSCYNYMFSGCTSLTSAPALPATTLAVYCYYSMFSGCTSLTTAPALPATTLAFGCYAYMFSGCSKLSSVTIKAENTASNAFDDWLEGVASTGTIRKKSSLTLETGASGIPSGWTVVNE